MWWPTGSPKPGGDAHVGLPASQPSSWWQRIPIWQQLPRHGVQLPWLISYLWVPGLGGYWTGSVIYSLTVDIGSVCCNSHNWLLCAHWSCQGVNVVRWRGWRLVDLIWFRRWKRLLISSTKGYLDNHLQAARGSTLSGLGAGLLKVWSVDQQLHISGSLLGSQFHGPHTRPSELGSLGWGPEICVTCFPGNF